MAHDLHLDDLLEQLRANGDRVTAPRRAVLDAFVAAGERHLSADDLVAAVRGTMPSVARSTIYRTLEHLEARGMVSRADLGPGPATYHLAADHHHHAVCNACGAVISLPPTALDPLRRWLDRHHGFAAHPHHLSIGGRCADCR